MKSPAVNWYRRWPADAPKTFFVDCVSGLGNRIKSFVAGARLARKMPGRLFCVGWPMDGYHCHCPLGLLFTTSVPTFSHELFHATGYIDYHAGNDEGPNFVDLSSDADVVWVADDNFFYAVGERGVVWGQHGPEKMENVLVRDELRAELAALVPHPAVTQAVEAFAFRHFDGHQRVIGVHVRRGDNAWANAYVPDELFPAAVAAVLKESPKDTVVFVATDSPQAQSLLLEAFPDNVVTFPRRGLERGQSWEAVQDALVEMYLLARTDVIIRTPSSTFSQCASWLGNVPTIEVGPLEHSW